MNTDDILKGAIDKYELSLPLPVEVRRSMKQSRKENLANILKRDSKRALFISTVVSFFFWVKRFGVSVTITKSVAAVSALMIIGLSVITAGGIYTAGIIAEYLKDEQATDIPIQNSKPEIEPEVKAIPPVQKAQVKVDYTVAVSPVEMDDSTKSLISEYTNTMIRELVKNSGKAAAININKLDTYHTSDKILTISIIRLDEAPQSSGTKSAYRLSAKVINAADSRVILFLSENADGEDKISVSISRLAEKISQKL